MIFPQVKKSIQIDGKELTFEIGRFAYQANAAVVARMGDTLVLATVTSAKPREDINYFPLYVEYQEKLYAGGKIKGSRWVKREGRPSDEAILTARLIDRSIRPLFPKDYKNEVQVIITILSVDGENDPDLLAIYAVSAALAISDIPWNGPVGATRVGLKDNIFFSNPVYKELEFSDLDLVLSGTRQEILMIEAGAKEVSEDNMVKALEFGWGKIKTIVDFITDLQKEIGQKKQTFKVKEIKAELVKTIEKKAGSQIKDVLKHGNEDESKPVGLDEIKEALVDQLEEAKSTVSALVDDYFKNLVREQIWQKKIRFDGRNPDKIRKLSIEVGVLPRTHGSAIFQRGFTQALTITTLGSPSLEMLIENMEGEETKRYMHHYYMPPYSVGETGRVGWPSRREVGHGALAERALAPVLPTEEQFPYTIRIVSEIMSSNGSTSMASVCGSSLSLMDAGVPIKKPVAGIAMGLIARFKNKGSKDVKIEDYIILTDILGLEDFIGDMDFKVAGTEDGITALQMDVKILGITPQILAEGIAQAKKARLFILGEMKKVIPISRASISQYAPKVAVLKIDKEKIGDIIGPGGRVIRQIIAETGVAMDVNDEGMVTISSIDKEGINKAIAWVEGLTREVQAGEEFMGEVKRIQPFGAFVEILPGKEGLVHVSQMSTQYVNNPEDIVKLGQKVKVRVSEIDEMKRINLSMLFGADAQKAPPRRPQGNFHRDRQNRPPKFFKKRF